MDAAPSEVLRSLLERARAAWPGIDLDGAVFLDALRRGAKDPARREVSEEYLKQVHVEDLYLACACAAGVPAALHAFDQKILARVASYMQGPPDLIEEIEQRVREKLLAPRREAPPEISKYTGLGALASWVRVITARTALDLRRNMDDKDELRADFSRLDQVLPEGDPEMDFMRRYAQALMADLLRDAVSELSSEQRNLLRLYYLRNLTTTQIGTLFQIDSSTVTRRLKDVQHQILLKVRKQLRWQRGLSESEYESLVGLCRSQLGLRLSQLLHTVPR